MSHFQHFFIIRTMRPEIESDVFLASKSFRFFRWNTHCDRFWKAHVERSVL